VLLTDGTRIETRSIAGTVGNGTNPLVRPLPVELQRGRIPCDPFCRVPAWPGVYAVGDNAAVPDPGSGQPFGAMVMVAFGEGEQAARNILADIRGQPLEPCHPARFGEVALLSRRYGVAQVRGIALHGWPASLVSRALFLSFMPTWRRRLALMLHWMGTAVLPDNLTPLPIGRSNTVVPMRFGAGESIVREGELSGRFYIITAGEVEVLQHVDGGERPIRRLHAGDYFGELALLSVVAAVIDPGRPVQDPALVGIREGGATSTVDRDRDRVGEVAIATVHRTKDPIGADPANVNHAARSRRLIELGLYGGPVDGLGEGDVPGGLFRVGWRGVGGVVPDEVNAARAASGDPGEEVRAFVAVDLDGCRPARTLVTRMSEPDVVGGRTCQVIR